jgi:hypothetical protein
MLKIKVDDVYKDSYFDVFLEDDEHGCYIRAKTDPIMYANHEHFNGSEGSY